ncbi:MAG: glycosyltransferase family 9 protein [Cytophagales bacterium]
MKILVIRFSALGDIALTVPAVRQVLHENPNCEIIFVSRPFVEPLFFGIERLHFHAVDTNKYRGFWGLIQLCNELYSKYRFSLFIDLHNSLRTRIIRYLLFFRGISTYVIDKGRVQKSKIINIGHQPSTPLKHHLQRYLDVFKKAGLQILPTTKPYFIKTKPKSDAIAEIFVAPFKGNNLIGIAPFAALPLKEWPFEKVEKLVNEITKQEGNIVLLFGGKNDVKKIEHLLSSSKIVSAIGLEGGLWTELALMKHLKIMLCMDSGNMHLAAGVGTKVAAIFGPTHPFLGFAPYLQAENTIQDRLLNCRPCSVFGNKPCHRGDHACMENITEKMVMERLSFMN